MDSNIKRLIEAIKQAGKQIKDDTVYMDDREDRVIGHAIGQAFETLAHQIEVKFAEESDADEEAHRDGKYCGKSSCRRCNTYPTPD